MRADGGADSGLCGARSHRPRTHPASVPRGNLGRPLLGPGLSKTLCLAAPKPDPSSQLPFQLAQPQRHQRSLGSLEAIPPRGFYTLTHAHTHTLLSPLSVLQGFCCSVPTLLSFHLPFPHFAPNSPTSKSPNSSICLTYWVPSEASPIALLLLPAHPAGPMPLPHSWSSCSSPSPVSPQACFPSSPGLLPSAWGPLGCGIPHPTLRGQCGGSSLVLGSPGSGEAKVWGQGRRLLSSLSSLELSLFLLSV